jgi:hypothetical protein
MCGARGRAWPDTSSRGPDSTGRTSTTTCGARARRGTHARPGLSLLMRDVPRPPSSLRWLCRTARRLGRSRHAACEARQPAGQPRGRSHAPHARPAAPMQRRRPRRGAPASLGTSPASERVDVTASTRRGCRGPCSSAHEACRRSAAALAGGAARVATWCLDGKFNSCRMKAFHARPGAWTAASACAHAAALRLRARHAFRGTTARATAVCAGPHRKAVERHAHTARAALLRPPHSLAHAGQGILHSTCVALTRRPWACRAVRAQGRRAGPHRAAQVRPTARRSPGTVCAQGRRPSASRLHCPATCHGPSEQQAGRLPRPARNRRLRAPACAEQLGGGRRSLVQQR